MFGAVSAFGAVDAAAGDRATCLLLPCLYCVPKLIRYDAQIGYVFNDPFFGRVWSRLSLTGVWVFHKALAVPDETTNVEFVIEYAVAPPPVPVDCGRAPT